MQVDGWNEHSLQKGKSQTSDSYDLLISQRETFSYRGPICGSGFQFRVSTRHISLGEGDAVGLIWAHQISSSKSQLAQPMKTQSPFHSHITTASTNVDIVNRVILQWPKWLMERVFNEC